MRELVSAGLFHAFSDVRYRPQLPITSSALLKHLILNESAISGGVQLRLSDQSAFDTTLQDFATAWEHGKIEFLKGDNLVVSSVALNHGINNEHNVAEDEGGVELGGTSSTRNRLAVSRSETINTELDEVYALLQKSTAKSRLLAERHASTSGSFEPICPHTTRQDCVHALTLASKSSLEQTFCEKIHFRPIIRPHTEPSLGHCSYLNTCFSEPTYSMSPSIHPLPAVPRPAGTALPSGLGAGGRGKDRAPCRYLHFEVDYDGEQGEDFPMSKYGHERILPQCRVEIGLGPEGSLRQPSPPQWINCDLRKFDPTALGKFHVIMADPPWDIHMSLPYGTMTDDEMLAMPIPELQDEGFLFLWVTGRAMEVGRECMRAWGYTRVDEVVWVKTNQLQRVIRTGRTGHWLNHTKEHLLVGLKNVVDEDGNFKWPAWANRGVDTDVIVSEVRETSRKPDEVYGIIERMCPAGRKLEIFGRKHNTRPGWLTLGNQLGNDQVHEPELLVRMRERYPERSKLLNDA